MQSNGFHIAYVLAIHFVLLPTLIHSFPSISLSLSVFIVFVFYFPIFHFSLAYYLFLSLQDPFSSLTMQAQGYNEYSWRLVFSCTLNKQNNTSTLYNTPLLNMATLFDFLLSTQALPLPLKHWEQFLKVPLTSLKQYWRVVIEKLGEVTPDLPYTMMKAFIIRKLFMVG